MISDGLLPGVLTKLQTVYIRDIGTGNENSQLLLQTVQLQSLRSIEIYGVEDRRALLMRPNLQSSNIVSVENLVQSPPKGSVGRT